MPSTYDSTFWHQRAQETLSLSEQMKESGAKEGMSKLARKYEQIALRGAYDEARIAFDSAREALRVSQGTASQNQISSLTRAVDKAWQEMRKARDAMEFFRSTHLSGDEIEVHSVDDPAALGAES